MKITVTSVRIDPEFAVVMAQKIAGIETDHHDDNYVDRVGEYMAELNLTFTHETPFGNVEIDVTGVLREDYNFSARLVARWINNIKLVCWLDGEEIGCNADELVMVIEKIIAV